MPAILSNDCEKLVKVESNKIIRVLKVPIRRTSKVNLSVEDIFKCICDKALVTEYLEDGSELRLDLSNYNTDNNEIIRLKKQQAEAAKKQEQEELAKKQREEELKKQKEQEELVKKQQAEEAAKKQQEDELAKKQQAEEAAKKQVEAKK